MKTSENLGTYYSPFTILKYDRIVEISQEKEQEKGEDSKKADSKNADQRRTDNCSRD